MGGRGWRGNKCLRFAAALLSAFTCQIISSKRCNFKAISNNIEVYKTEFMLQAKSNIKEYVGNNTMLPNRQMWEEGPLQQFVSEDP